MTTPGAASGRGVANGEVEEVSPLIRRVTANNPGPFTYRGTGTCLVGRGAVAVIDPGPDDAAHVDALLAALEPGERISHLVVTHTHGDHSPAAATLRARTGAPVFGYGLQAFLPDPDAAAKDAIVFGDPEADAPPPGSEQPGPDGAPARPGGDPGFRANVRLRDGDVVESDGWTLEAIHTPGHASNHLCYLLREEGTLFSGDHVMGWSTTVVSPPDGDLGAYLASLRRLLDRPDAARYVPAHGPPIEHPHELVASMLAHRVERDRQIVAGLEAGDGTIVELVRRIYADTAKVLWRAAAGTVFAHLLDLRVRGEVEALDDPPRRTSRWVRTG